MEAVSKKNLDHLCDEDLMEMFQGGYEQAFNILLRRYKDRVHNFLYRYTHNHQDCEDLVQETFLRIYRSRNSYERIAKFSTWMYTIALNLAKSLYKKNQRMTTISMHKNPEDSEDRKIEIEDPNLSPEEVVNEKICVEQVEKALKELSEDFREVVVLRDVQQLSYEEIMEITDLPMGTVKSRINRGRSRLQELLKTYNVQPETFLPG